MTTSRSEELAPAFIKALRERSKLYGESRIRKANRLFDQSRSIAAEMMADKISREMTFKLLTTHEFEDVVVSAAAYLLPIDETFAVAVLRRIAESGESPENQISAEYCVKEWEAGHMNDIRALA